MGLTQSLFFFSKGAYVDARTCLIRKTLYFENIYSKSRTKLLLEAHFVDDIIISHFIMFLFFVAYIS